MKKITCLFVFLILFLTQQAYAEWYELWDKRENGKHTSIYTRSTLRIQVRYNVLNKRTLDNPTPNLVPCVEVYVWLITGKEGRASGGNQFFQVGEDSYISSTGGLAAYRLDATLNEKGDFYIQEIDPAYHKHKCGHFDEEYEETDVADFIPNLDIDIVSPDVPIVLGRIKSLNLRINAARITGDEDMRVDVDGDALFRTTIMGTRDYSCILTPRCDEGEKEDNPVQPHFFVKGKLAFDADGFERARLIGNVRCGELLSKNPVEDW